MQWRQGVRQWGGGLVGWWGAGGGLVGGRVVGGRARGMGSFQELVLNSQILPHKM